jgi:hypothetical protein
MAPPVLPDVDPLNSQIFIARALGPRLEEPARMIVGIVATFTTMRTIGTGSLLCSGLLLLVAS